MNGFQLWFVYFDSLFLNSHPRISVDFYQFHAISNAAWPQQPCPALSFIYQLLQSFITSKSTWNVSKCRADELQRMETQINDLMRLIQLQKTYAFLYWESDSRRIQASLVHFYTYLQLLTKSVIPYPTMSLFQCNTANKLCIKIGRLERFMNEILKVINKLGLFFSSEKFHEEFNFINNFFQNFLFFMKKLPTIKKNKLNHVHSLVKYICLTNPIQICSNGVQKSPIRKKSKTIKGYLTDRKKEKEFVKSKSLDSNRINESPQQSYRKKSAQILLFNQIQKNSAKKNQNLFSLPTYLVDYAKQFQNRSKVMTVSSLRSLTNKKQSIKKMKSIQTNQTSFSFVHVDKSPKNQRRLKSKSSYQHENITTPKKKQIKNGSFSIGRNTSLSKLEQNYYQKEEQRYDGLQSMKSSKQSSFRRRQTSIMTPAKNVLAQKEPVEDKPTEKKTLYEFQKKYSLRQNKIILGRWEKLIVGMRQRKVIQQINRLSINYKS